MTKSELICNEIGKKFFNGDFVYQGLHYINSLKNKIDYLKKALKSAKVFSNLIEGVNHHYAGKEKEVMKNILTWLKGDK